MIVPPSPALPQLAREHIVPAQSFSSFSSFRHNVREACSRRSSYRRCEANLLTDAKRTSSAIVIHTMLAAFACALVSYEIVDLGLPPEAEKVKSVEAVAINNRGDVLISTTQENYIIFGKGYLWRNGQFVDFGEPPYGGLDGTKIQPNAVNDSGTVVGGVGGYGPLFMSGLEDKKAFIWNGKRMELLFPKDTIAHEGLGINNAGDIVGNEGHSAFARLRGKLVGLPAASHVEPSDPSGEMGDVNQAYAVAINDRRQVLVNSTYGRTQGELGLPSRPFLIDGNSSRLKPRPVPLPKGFLEGRGVALNARGTVLAIAIKGRKIQVPYLVRDGHLVRLPFAGALNGKDEVVGGSPLSIWRDGSTTRLPDFPGWALQSATGMNDKGQICGLGLHDGKTRAFLLSPSHPSAP
jgi:hypothetical protein